jgi:hypothetical protein
MRSLRFRKASFSVINKLDATLKYGNITYIKEPYMKMLLFIFLVAIVSMFIGGCAKDSGVLIAKDSNSLFDDAVCPFETKILAEDTTGNEQYRVYQQGATGYVPPSVVREEVYQQAQGYCDKLDKSLKVLKETNPPFRLGCYPKAEIVFICVPKPKITSFEDQLYIKLTNLKKLLDEGTITKEEFELQKTKILNQK